jgi:AcrR family transcriptional regulator
MADRGTRDRRTTRERILVAALELFVDRGYAGTTVSAIEREVGLAVGTGSFYRHFRSKDDVFVAAIERSADRYAKQFDGALEELAAIEDPAERLTRDYEMRLAAMRQFDSVWRVIDAERTRFPQLPGRFVSALEMDRWELAWEDSPVPAIAMAALLGYAQLSTMEGGPYRRVSSAEFIGALVDMMTAAGVMPPPRSAPRE